jgi:SAM-dependent methyltransferase
MKNDTISWEEAVNKLRDNPSHKLLVLSCYYDDPLQESADRFYLSTEWQAVQRILSGIKQGKALDVGAGRGISSYALAKDGWLVTALEPDRSAIVGSGAIKQLSQTGVLNISVIEGKGETLPFGDKVFDLVYGRAVLHHAEDLKKFCEELVRVLKPGGFLIATREHVLSQKKDLQTFLDSHPLHSLYGGEHAYILDEYEEALCNAGLHLENVIKPYDSNINLFPDNLRVCKENISRKIGFYIPDWLFKRALTPLLNKLDKTPGRLYSFMGKKR